MTYKCSLELYDRVLKLLVAQRVSGMACIMRLFSWISVKNSLHQTIVHIERHVEICAPYLEIYDVHKTLT